MSQGTIPSDKPIAYASRTLNETETKYSTIEKELLAIVWACKYFRPYLFGRKFYIYTDHRPLVWLFNLKEPNSKLVRWRLRLEEYDYLIESIINNPDDSNQNILEYLKHLSENPVQDDNNIASENPSCSSYQ